jgi:hypothetical protein
MSVINEKINIYLTSRRDTAVPTVPMCFGSYRFRFRAFTTRFRLLPTFFTAFFTAEADLRVFFAV